MWLDALDGGPGLQPEILFLGDTMIVVLTIAADTPLTAGVKLVLRCRGNDVSAAVRPNPRPRLTP